MPGPPAAACPSRFTRAIIIGIHGWALAGGALSDPPLAVSAKYCQRAEAALRRRASLQHPGDGGQAARALRVTCVPLAGFGRVEQRVELYLGEGGPLLAQRDALASADLVLVACHSQGVVVACLLLQRLLQAFLVFPSAQCVAVVAMAGVNQGPYPDLPGDMYPATR